MRFAPTVVSAPLVAVALLASRSNAQQPTTPRAPAAAVPLAFTGVTVVGVRGGRLLPQHTVVVTGNRIRAVGPEGTVDIPKGTRVVDAQGKYLIPGLWDMHVHSRALPDSNIDSIYRRFHSFYVASGVTGIREMAQRFPGDVDSFRVWQREIAAGGRVGPRLVGPAADVTFRYGSGSDPMIDQPEDAARIIDSLKAAGMTFVKFHDDNADPDYYFAIAREVRRVGLPFVGHVPTAVSPEEASDSGQRSVEHA